MRRPLAVLAAVVIPAVLLIGVLAGAGGAQDEPTPRPAVEIREGDSPVGGSIPQPNSGQAPVSPNDRGGVVQLLLLGLILGFFAIAIFSIRRQMRKANEPKPMSDRPS